MSRNRTCAVARYLFTFLLTPILAMLLATSNAYGTTVLHMSVNDLVDHADLIFSGTVTSSEVVPSLDGTFLFTYVTLQVDDTYKGKVASRELTLRLHGGDDGVETIDVAGMPEFEAGKSYLLFVKDNDLAACPILGWGQGFLRFQSESTDHRILEDEQGAKIKGLAAGEWIRGEPEAGHKANIQYSTATQGGVIEIRDAGGKLMPSSTGSSSGPTRAMTEKELVAALRSLISTRSHGASYVPGKVVLSANKQNVPESVEGVTTPLNHR